MPRSHKHGNEAGRSWPVVVAALAVFGAFGSLQMILAALNVHLVHAAPAAPTSSHGVALVQASGSPGPVTLPATARPAGPDQAPASMPTMNSAKEIALVADEDARIRTLVHDSARARQPEVIQYQGALPTLILPARSAAYTDTDLAQHGALAVLSSRVALLQENVFVAPGAQLSLGAPALSTLYLASSGHGFASIVGWGGSLSFTGTAAQPFTITGWDRAAKSAAADRGDGRAYIREIGGAMTFAHARVSSLGFWSGRTGGVAWTGASRQASKGSAADSAFTGDTYGAFVSRGQGVTFSGDLFESNELDGLHIHRYSAGSRVTSSAAARNGGNGFVVDRATQDTLLRGDVSRRNAANGYLFDGRPLVSGASASGGSNVPSSGTVLEGSSATGNAHTSVLIEGGSGTVVKSDQFCSPTTAIALRTGVTNAVITGNYLGCAPRSGISVGPAAPGTVIFGNIVSHPGIGLLIRSSGAVTMDDNRIIGATVFGVSARNATSSVSGVGNALSGTGDRAVDVRTGASVSGLSGTDTSGWSHNARVTPITYLEFHPLASLWLGILVVILLAAGWSFRRKLPAHPYPASVRRMYPLPAPGESGLALEAHPAYLQSHAARSTAVQPAVGRSPARRAGPPAAWNAPASATAGRPQPAPWPQPGFPPAPPPSRPAHRDPDHRDPAYREPTLGTGRRPRPASGPAPAGWYPPARDAARWQQPAPTPRPAAPPPAPPPWTPAGPGMPGRHGAPVDNRATRAQRALPPEAHRPPGQERPDDPSGEGAPATRPMQRGVWE